MLLNDAAEERIPEEYGGNVTFAFGAKGIAKVLTEVDVVVKSPGVSLYRDDIQSARKNGVQITSLLNLWFADDPDITTIEAFDFSPPYIAYAKARGADPRINFQIRPLR